MTPSTTSGVASKRPGEVPNSGFALSPVSQLQTGRSWLTVERSICVNDE